VSTAQHWKEQGAEGGEGRREKGGRKGRQKK